MRIDFLAAIGLVVLAAPTALLTAGCGSDMSQTTGDGGGGGTTSNTGGAGGEGGEGGAGGGGGATCVPSREVCDGLDNDCDGAVDDGDPGAGLACETGQPGACAAGTTACEGGAIVCSQSVQPSAEICNGLDDDCDGETDDGNPEGNTSCATGKPGVCAAGTTACQDGAVVCNENEPASDEVCDGLDNDCDGLVDDGDPGGGLPCDTGAPGVCAAGTTTCQGGDVACVQAAQPAAETCNGADDDCDGAADEDNPCTGPGQVCAAGSCVPDCTSADAVPCEPGTVCNVSDAAPGACVPEGSECIVTGPTVPCGASQCGPGSACNPGTQMCEPALPCTQVVCDGPNCHGAACPCDRPPPVCTVATLAQLNVAGFVGSTVDLDFDYQCNGYAVTWISGTDFLRKITPAGQVSSTAGVSNLNMGEIAVPHGEDGAFGGDLFDASIAYNCCAGCGCSGTPQGIGHLQNDALPMILTATITTGTGPFGVALFDTGPTGLNYGLDGRLHAGNMVTNGDYYAIDTTAKTKTLIATLPSRVHASTPFDSHRMLVALQSKDIVLLELTDGTTTPFATAPAFVTSLERDPFSGHVFVALAGGAIHRYSAAGVDLGLFATGQKSGRIALAPDNQLYFLNAAVSGASTIQVFPLPSSY